MRKTSPVGKKTASKGMILGLRAYEKISAVEGIRVSSDLKRDLQMLDAQGMSSDQRTCFITDKYGKKSP